MVSMRTPARPSPSRLRWGTTLVSVAVAAAVTFATPAAARPLASTDPVVQALLARRVENPHLGAHLGVIVTDATTGEVVFAHDADSRFLPASNMKIVTAVALLQSMGPDARFRTSVKAGATPQDIVLVGGGDPLLSTRDLDQLAAQAAAKLPTGSKVRVHLDTSLFPAVTRAPGWTNQYLPWVVAPVVSLARLGEYGPHPDVNAAKAFVSALRTHGVKARLGKRATADASADTITSIEPHTTGDAVAVMLRESENNIAEVLHRHVALATGHEPSWAGAKQATHEILAHLGIDDSGMQVQDGSGLSRTDRVSPRFLAEVLRVARVEHPDRFTAMFTHDAMPISGMTGTLDDRYGRFITPHSRCARGDVHAKTGSLFDTITLSGVASTTDGGERIFSILVNDRPRRYSGLSTRQAIDGLTATITGCWH